MNKLRKLSIVIIAVCLLATLSITQAKELPNPESSSILSTQNAAMQTDICSVVPQWESQYGRQFILDLAKLLSRNAGAVGDIGNLIKTYGADAVGGLGDLLATYGPGIVQGAGDLISQVGPDIIQGLGDVIAGFGADAIQWLGKTLTENAQTQFLRDVGRIISNDVSGTAREIGNLVKKYGPDAVAELGHLVKSYGPQLVGDAGRLLAQYGPDLMQSLGGFINQYGPSAVQSISSVISNYGPGAADRLLACLNGLPDVNITITTQASPEVYSGIANGVRCPWNEGAYVSIPKTLNLRSGPGTQYPKLTTVKPGDCYPIVEMGQGWVRINTSWGPNWVSLDYVQVHE